MNCSTQIILSVVKHSVFLTGCEVDLLCYLCYRAAKEKQKAKDATKKKVSFFFKACKVYSLVCCRYLLVTTFEINLEFTILNNPGFLMRRPSYHVNCVSLWVRYHNACCHHAGKLCLSSCQSRKCIHSKEPQNAFQPIYTK